MGKVTTLLDNINGLYNLEFVGNNLDITNNENLSSCCGIEPILSNSSLSIGGNIIFVGANNIGCNSTEEVLNVCTTSNHSIKSEKYNISPNPFQDKFDISIEHGQATSVSLFDINGQLILNNPINGNYHSISLEEHPTGIYILELRDNSGQSSTQKIIKI